MKSHLEHLLRARIRAAKARDESVRSVIAGMLSEGLIQNEKQAHATLQKWSRRGEYEYGVTLDLGWLVEK